MQAVLIEFLSLPVSFFQLVPLRAESIKDQIEVSCFQIENADSKIDMEQVELGTDEITSLDGKKVLIL